MALPYLYKAGQIKEHKEKIVLSYDKSDPIHQKQISVSMKQAAEILKEARGKALDIMKTAEQEANDIKRESRRKSDLEYNAITAQLQEQRKEFEAYCEEQRQELKRERENQEQELFETRRRLEQEAEAKYAEIEKIVHEKVYKEATELAMKDSVEECERLVQRVQVILDEAIKQRTGILAEVESQITNLVLLIAKKVVKSMTDAQSDIVIRNVVSSLKNLKGREHFVIRINSKDAQTIKKYMSQLQKCIESTGTITLAEDSKVDVGGCIIETEFGEVDARIATQLQKIEQSIREAVPVKHG